MGLHDWVASWKVGIFGLCTGERITVQDGKRSLVFIQLFYGILTLIFRSNSGWFEGFGDMCDKRSMQVHGYESQIECLERQVTLRMCTSVMMLFLLLVLFTLVTCGYQAITSLWVIKFAIPLILFFVTSYLQDDVFYFVEFFGGHYAAHAYLYTYIMILNLSCSWNDRWQAARMEDFSNGFNGLSWIAGKFGVGLFFYGISVVISVLLIFRTWAMNDEFDNERYGRHVEGAFYVVCINLAFCTIFMFLTCLPPFTKASFLTTGMICFFLTVTIWGAVLFNMFIGITQTFWPFVTIFLMFVAAALIHASNETRRRHSLGSIYEKGATTSPPKVDIGMNDVEKEWDCYSEANDAPVRTEFQDEQRPATQMGRTFLYLLFHMAIPALIFTLSTQITRFNHTPVDKLFEETLLAPGVTTTTTTTSSITQFGDTTTTTTTILSEGDPFVILINGPILFWGLCAANWITTILYLFYLLAPFFKCGAERQIQAQITKDEPVEVGAEGDLSPIGFVGSPRYGDASPSTFGGASPSSPYVVS